MTHAPKVLPVVLALGLLTACTSSTSGGGAPTSSSPTSSTASSGTVTSGTSTTSTTSTTSSSTGSTTSAGDAPTAATMSNIVVQRSDLPSGWTGKPAQAQTDQDKDVAAQLAVCVGSTNASNQDQIQQVQSDDFTLARATISSDVSSYPNQADVVNQVAQLQSPKAQGCLNSLFKKEISASLPSGATIEQIGIRLTLGTGGGPSNLAGFANGSVTVSAQGQSLKVYIGAAFFTGRQLTGTISFTSIGTPVNTTLANRLVVAVAQRAASA